MTEPQLFDLIQELKTINPQHPIIPMMQKCLEAQTKEEKEKALDSFFAAIRELIPSFPF
jgi:hypothetical protein